MYSQNTSWLLIELWNHFSPQKFLLSSEKISPPSKAIMFLFLYYLCRENVLIRNSFSDISEPFSQLILNNIDLFSDFFIIITIIFDHHCLIKETSNWELFSIKVPPWISISISICPSLITLSLFRNFIGSHYFLTITMVLVT